MLSHIVVYLSLCLSACLSESIYLCLSVYLSVCSPMALLCRHQSKGAAAWELTAINSAIFKPTYKANKLTLKIDLKPWQLYTLSVVKQMEVTAPSCASTLSSSDPDAIS